MRTEWTNGDKETDQRKIEQRLKQVQYGYNTAGYDRYLQLVPKTLRGDYNTHPRTPDAYLLQSKRQWDGRVQKWRRELHKWDPEGINDASAAVATIAGVDGDAEPGQGEAEVVDAAPDAAEADGGAGGEANDDDDDDVL